MVPDSLGLGDHDLGRSIIRFGIFQKLFAKNKVDKLSWTDYVCVFKADGSTIKH